MTKEQFIKIINLIQDFEKEVDRWDDFGISLCETPIYNIYGELVEFFLNSVFTENGIDWINWWLYDRISITTGEYMKVYDEENKLVPTETVEDLWNLVKYFQK